MKQDCIDALGLALDRGIAGDAAGEPWLFFNASPIQGITEEWKQSLLCVQDFRPDYLSLKSNGYSLIDRIEDCPNHKGILFVLGKNRTWNEHQLQKLWARIDGGNRLIVTGDKNGGIQSIRKWFSSAVDITDSFSKFHSVVFWADQNSSKSALAPIDILKEIDGYQLAEGMFSSDGPDTGSRLLAEYFDSRIGGAVADLGAGWGYLSSELLKRSDRVTRIDLFEADRSALSLAEENVGRSKAVDCSFNWIDVTSEFPKKPYDWVIMNPPFHVGRKTDPALGQRFIEVAASTLPRGGRMLMVANRNLPYERKLEQAFGAIETLEERDGFKVIEARK